MTIGIKTKDAGPIKDLEFQLREPGIYVVRGANGAGKTTLLDAVDYAAGTGTQRPERRIGAKAGSVEVGGAVLKLGAKVTRGGKLQVQSVAGQRCLGVLIDADGVADGVRADARRIEALIQMAGVSGGKDEFLAVDPSVSEILDEYPDSMPFCNLADAVRARLNAAALEAEKNAVSFAGQAEGAKAAAGPVDSALAQTDPEALRGELAQAIAEQQRLAAEQRAAEKSAQAAAYAAAKISEARKTELPSVEQINMEIVRVGTEVSRGKTLIKDAEEKLAAARQLLAQHEATIRQLGQQKKEAEQRETLYAGWERQVAAGTMTGPAADEIAAAEQSVNAARQRIEAAAVARKAAEQLAAADDFAEAAEISETKGKRFRKAARAVDGVLAAQIERLGTPCRVEDGRLVVDHGDRAVYVHDLSPGERAKLFCAALVSKLGPGGLGTVDQECWLRMDGAGKRAFHEMVTQAGAYVIAEGVEEDPERCGEPVSVERYEVA